MKSSIFSTLISFTILITASSAGLAQYVWIDENGHKQYSDQSPPASVPQSKILKYPDNPMNIHTGTPNENKHKEPENLAEKELDYQKRRDEAAAKQKKETGDVQAAADKKENCKRMQDYKRSLDSGARINQVNANGEQAYMTDAQRAQEQSTVNQHMQDCDG